MNREELTDRICPVDRTIECINPKGTSSCTGCQEVLDAYLDEYDKHVIAEYEAEHGNLADMIRDIHDCVSIEMYRKGVDDLKYCLIRNSRTECIDGTIHLIVTEDRIRFIADQLKEQK